MLFLNLKSLGILEYCTYHCVWWLLSGKISSLTVAFRRIPALAQCQMFCYPQKCIRPDSDYEAKKKLPCHTILHLVFFRWNKNCNRANPLSPISLLLLKAGKATNINDNCTPSISLSNARTQETCRCI